MAGSPALDEPPPKPLLRRIFNRKNVAGGVGFLLGRGLGLGSLGSGLLFLGSRWLFSRAEQLVPFTARRHIILLPTTAEVMLGKKWYDDFLADAGSKRLLLPASHPDCELVVGVAKRLIAALQEGRGGGYQKHLAQFQWQVSVVNQPIANAFVFSGGKIVVYTGLLDLLVRDGDLVAMVMGHEIGHALARHQSEKMGMGLVISMAGAMLVSAVNGGGSQAQQQQAAAMRRQMEAERARRGYHRTHSRLVDDDGGGQAAHLAGQGQGGGHYGASAAAPAGHGQQQVPGFLSEQLVHTLSNVLLELPFSRRAETEADLIGLKLMALAGFNPAQGPRAFMLLAEASGQGAKQQRGGQDALIASLGCTHPDSRGRAALLQKELAWMAANQQLAVDGVGTKVDYWSTGAELPGGSK